MRHEEAMVLPARHHEGEEMTRDEKMAELVESAQPIHLVRELAKEMECPQDEVIAQLEEIESVAKAINSTPLFHWVLVKVNAFEEGYEIGINLPKAYADMWKQITRQEL
jgi:hypothetical protein